MSVLIVSKDKASLALKIGQTPAGARGLTGPQGEQGIQGEQGDAFVYSNFTAQQLADLKGDKGDQGDQGIQGIQGEQGDAFVYSNFTAQQLADLKGDKGDKGLQGNAFVYTDFTAAQLASLKGEQGDPVPITTALGQSSTEAVSQKLLTDEIANMNNTLGDIGAALNNINGV